jgi:hypothetical protein
LKMIHPENDYSPISGRSLFVSYFLKIQLMNVCHVLRSWIFCLYFSCGSLFAAKLSNCKGQALNYPSAMSSICSTASMVITCYDESTIVGLTAVVYHAYLVCTSSQLNRVKVQLIQTGVDPTPNNLSFAIYNLNQV